MTSSETHISFTSLPSHRFPGPVTLTHILQPGALTTSGPNHLIEDAYLVTSLGRWNAPSKARGKVVCFLEQKLGKLARSPLLKVQAQLTIPQTP